MSLLALRFTAFAFLHRFISAPLNENEPVKKQFEHKKTLYKAAFVECLVARAGFEPTYTEPKSVVLPLDDRAIPFLVVQI